MTPWSGSARSVHSLRGWGVLALVMFLLTSAVGGSLALESSYLWITLASHIGLAVVTLAITGYAASIARRAGYTGAPRASSGLAAFGALGATVSGIVFLLAGQSNYALYAMEGFAVLGILTSIVMIVVGRPREQQIRAGAPG
jgi:hypothetical protein